MIREITQPNFLIKSWMYVLGFEALATPWKTIYWYDSSYITPELRRHEYMHIEQMERDGIVKFMIMYNWFWITKGYDANPYEIEAKNTEKKMVKI